MKNKLTVASVPITLSPGPHVIVSNTVNSVVISTRVRGWVGRGPQSGKPDGSEGVEEV